MKRLIGLPGDTVSEHNGAVSIDGKPTRSSRTRRTRCHDKVEGSWRVPPGTTSSWATTHALARFANLGPVRRSNLIGPLLTYWPPTRLSLH